jgi:hypothetical protein
VPIIERRRHKKKESFEEVERLAYQMGLMPVDFYSVSPKEFMLMAEGYRARRIDDYKLNRNIIFMMARLWSSKPPNSPNDLWDLGDEVVQSSDDELAKLFEAVKNKNG